MRAVRKYAIDLWALSAAVCACTSSPWASAAALNWKPEKNLEIIVSSDAGGGNDRTARVIQKILQGNRQLDTTVTVVNKPGGGGAVAWTYLNQHAGDGHYLSTSISSLLTNHITGRSPLNYTDVTPIAQLFSEYIAFMVKADSAIQSGGSLVEQLKKNPGALNITVGAGAGNHNHIALALLAKAVGVDPRKLKTIVFKSSSEASTALMGGHVDVAITPASTAMVQLKSGRVKVIAVTAPRRLRGALASVPTWREQGIPVVLANWRGIIGPRGLDSAQIAYWESTFFALVKTEEWKRELESNDLQDTFAGAAETKKILEAEYGVYKNVLMELGLARSDSAR